MSKPVSYGSAALLFGATLFAMAAAVPSATAVDAETGGKLVRQWCTSCHLVGPDAPAVDAGPPFEEIANDPRTTPGGFRAWLADPHPPMPNLNLSRDEIEAIIAYLESLKTP